MNLNSILIGSEDPKRLAEYYTKLFGKPAYEGDDFSGWQIGTGWMTVGLHDQVKGKNAHPGRVIWNIETPDVEGAVRKAPGCRRRCGPGTVSAGRRDRDVDRHVLRSGRQLLPARQSHVTAWSAAAAKHPSVVTHPRA